VADAVEAQWHGHDYQARFFWIHAASLRDPARPDVIEVTYEADGPKAFDDVIVRYSPGRPSNGPNRISVDYHQIKFHTTKQGRFGFADLIDPAFIGAASVSILQRLAQAKGAAPADAAFTLVTTDRIADLDPLGDLISQVDCSIRLDKLFDSSKTDGSRMGKVRKCWREHLGLSSNEELKQAISGLHVREGHYPLDEMRNQVNTRFRIVGLSSCEDAMEFRYDSAARTLKVKGINCLTRLSFEALCREEKWLHIDRQTDYLNVSLRSFGASTPADLLDAAPDNTLSLLSNFENRHLRQGASWEDLALNVRTFLERMLGISKHIRLFLDTHASVAFLAGAVLGFKSGAAVEIMQKGRSGTQRWNADDQRSGPSPGISQESVGEGPDIAVSVGLARDSGPKVKAYVAAGLPRVGRILYSLPVGGPGQRAINGGAHAAQVAEAVAAAVATTRTPGAVTHVFIAGPNAFSFMLGQHAQSMGVCIPYEFDFGGRVDGTYCPTFRI
jgi:hypothetical protein